MECTGSKSVAEENKCMEFNCENLWRRRAALKMDKNVNTELKKLK
jgi:hypothetical protein